ARTEPYPLALHDALPIYARALRVAAAAVDAVVGLVDAGDATGRARVGRAEGHGDRMVLPAARRVVAGDRSGRVVEDLNLEVGCEVQSRCDLVCLLRHREKKEG